MTAGAGGGRGEKERGVGVHLGGPGPVRGGGSRPHPPHSPIAPRGEEDPDGWAARARAAPWSPDGTRRDASFWAEHYLGYLAARPDSVAAALRVIGDAPGAAVVHCAAGKDRTGTVVAMALDVAGGPHDQSAAD